MPEPSDELILDRLIHEPRPAGHPDRPVLRDGRRLRVPATHDGAHQGQPLQPPDQAGGRRPGGDREAVHTKEAQHEHRADGARQEANRQALGTARAPQAIVGETSSGEDPLSEARRAPRTPAQPRAGEFPACWQERLTQPDLGAGSSTVAPARSVPVNDPQRKTHGGCPARLPVTAIARAAAPAPGVVVWVLPLGVLDQNVGRTAPLHPRRALGRRYGGRAGSKSGRTCERSATSSGWAFAANTRVNRKPDTTRRRACDGFTDEAINALRPASTTR
jgi:hypothetical protein